MDNLHSGHKQRLRDKAKEDIDTLSEHEVLELILNYTVVRSNMNPVAHKLIKRFGSLSNVLDADEKSLLKVDGLGPVSASFLTLIPKIVKRYKQSKATKNNKIDTIRDAMDYFLDLLDTLNKEELYVLCLDKNDRIITLLNVAHGNLDTINIDIKDIIRQILVYLPARVIFAHNHIQGVAYPSQGDIDATKELVRAIESLGIEFSDHIIIAHNDVFSFRLSKMLNKE